MQPIFILLIVCHLLLSSCNNEPNATKDSAVLEQPKTIGEIEGRLFKADSVQVIYYDDPDGDSLRYTRYFTYAAVNDTPRVNALLREMKQVFVHQPARRNCRSEGKLFLLNNDDVLKTVYFSLRKDSCRYFYFIKDGSFIYFPVTETAGKWLQEAKQKARKPVINPA